jgi:outer membrane receptor for ferrienterochelin and colicin
MRTKIQTAIYFLTFMVSLSLLAQEDTVRGVVQEVLPTGKKSPVIGASVFWLGTTKGTVTDTNGIFRLATEPRRYKLVISFVGYRSDTLTVVGENDLQVILQSENTLQEVEVAASKSSTFTDYLSPAATKIMTEKELFKAACCNLSESFETNPSVDVAFSDAVTGTKQIQMLGLAGIYTQITTENMPGIRGLASNYGLSYIPGTWIESIQVTKGTGSVINGYESMAGQINVELKKPQTAEKLYANIYGNQMGRLEGNLNLTQHLNKKWGTTLLLHGNIIDRQTDMNMDGFMDIPTGRQFNIVNRWNFTDKNWIVQLGIKLLNDQRKGGQMAEHGFMEHDTTTHIYTPKPYQFQLNTERYEVFGKIGYVFPKQKYKSIGLQVSGVSHNFFSSFGNTAVNSGSKVYDGKERTFYSNLIYQSIIGNTNHKFKTGISFLYDDFRENFNTQNLARTEIVPGFFGEYSYDFKEKLTIVAGLRGDYHNIFGFFVTPRLHARYAFTENTTLRASFGRGQRTANLFAENTAIFVSSREIFVNGNDISSFSNGYKGNAEVSWNSGLSVLHEFSLFGKDASLNLDFYRTDFQKQLVVNLENPQQIRFETLDDKSFSNSFQAELEYKPIRKLELRLAYRWFDVKTTYNNQLLQRPFVSKNRAFANVAYEWRKWKLDYTINWNGLKRIPNTSQNPEAFRKNDFSPNYFIMNVQLSKTFAKTLDVYVGVENLTNFRQADLINSYQNPYSPYFDALLVWGPVIGRMPYIGARWKIN